MQSSRSLLLALLVTAAGGNAWAQDDIWTRKTLLDTPGGPKQELAARGADLGFDVTQFVQGLSGSGKGWPSGGKADLRFRLDGQKLGTWAGFFVTGPAEYNYGSNALPNAAGLNVIAVNTALGFPSLYDSMTSVLFGQFGCFDGNLYAFQKHGFIGLAGNDMMDRRQLDCWGVGCFSYQRSDAFKGTLPIFNQLVADMGVEVFYNWAVTPWMRLSTDAHWERPFNGRDKHYFGLRAQSKIS